MNFQKMEIISTGTDFAVCYNFPLWCPNVISVLPLEERLLQGIFIKQPRLKVSVNLSIFLHLDPTIALYGLGCKFGTDLVFL
jgi:hypothetical protein